MIEHNESKSQNCLLDHVILPRVLPQHKSSYTHEQALIDQIIENVDGMSDWLPPKTVEMMKRLKRVNYECTPTVISELINELRSPGDTFSMFVRWQNTAVIFYIPKDTLDTKVSNGGEPDHITVAIFPGCLHPRVVYDNDSDVEVKKCNEKNLNHFLIALVLILQQYNYPVQAYNVKFSTFLRSKHFANQLSLLHEELPAENVNCTDYVSKWLMTLLTDEKSTTTSIDQCPVVTKKIRDEALGQTDKNFFRRSSYYMSVKVMLQHSLTVQLGAQLGKFVYKVVMLSFFNELCSDYKEPDFVHFDPDLMSQMIAKMARRIDKLSHNEPPTAINQNISQMYDHVVREAKDTIQAIRHIIDNLTEDIQNGDTESAHLSPIIQLNFEADTCYKMPKLLHYLRARANEKPQTTSHSKRKSRSYRRWYKNGNRFVANANIPQNEMSESFYWTDYENFVLYQMMDVAEYYEYDDLFVIVPRT